MRRRHFLTLSTATVGGLLVYTLDRKPIRAHAQSRKIRVPLKFFNEREAFVIAAAAGRILPSDSTGPGATEAGVIIYIDRQLASPFGRDVNRYTQPPFEEGVPEQGYQGKATPREVYREGLALLGRDFDRLTPEEQDAKLRSIETTWFFRLLRQNTIEGMFCDPMHGGNADLIGWQMIGYPGPYMSWADHIDQHYGKSFRPAPKSLGDVLGRQVKPWEDEV